MLRVAIPIVLALASATVLRTLLLPLIVSILAGVVLTSHAVAEKEKIQPRPDKERAG